MRKKASFGFAEIGMANTVNAKNGIGVVTVEGGQVSGVASDVAGVTVFKGIPFAAPPIGENRWKAPQPVKKWNGVKVCDKYGNSAWQPDLFPKGTYWYEEFYHSKEFMPPNSEDCLYLNVYTPAKTNKDQLPVLVWIHGGGFQTGSASEEEFLASKLAAKGVIVVNIQYRLGIFGFMALDELSKENKNGVSGNYAMLDQIKGLQWVKDNIKGFGGNSKEVTIAGQSAGAMSVKAMLSTPLAKGLFKRAIIQSDLNGYLNKPENRAYGVYFGDLGYSDLAASEVSSEKTLKEVFGKNITLKELRKMPATAFTNPAVFGKLNAAAGWMKLDGYVFTKESLDLMANGKMNGINIMIGGTSDEEASLWGVPGTTMKISDFYKLQKEKFGSLYEKYDLEKLYAPKDETEAYRMSMRIKADGYFEAQRMSAEYTMAHNDNKTYVYYFNHNLPPHKNSKHDQNFYLTGHSADLWYMFNSLRNVAGQREWTDKDFQLGDIMSSYWANFVKTGNPNGTGLTKWIPCSPQQNGAFMEFTDGKAICTSDSPFGGEYAADKEKLHSEYLMQLYKLSDKGLYTY